MDGNKFIHSGGPDSCRMLIVGVGGAGCNSLKAWAGLKADTHDLPDMIAMHTDSQVLDHSPIELKIQLGLGVTGGMSTGGDARKGALCVEESSDAIRQVFRGYNLIFFIVGLGGGTGGGATPHLIRLAAESGAFTICLATMPFMFEGDRRRSNAEIGMASLKEHAQAVICFPNQRLFELVKDEKVSLVRSLEVADTYLSHGLSALWKLMTEPGLINLNFGDVQSLVSHSNGSCTMASVEYSGKNRVERIVQAVRALPLLDKGAALAKAKGLLIGVMAGPSIRLDEFEQIINGITEVANPDVHLFLGTSISQDMGTAVSVTVMVSEQWIESSTVMNEVALEGHPVPHDHSAPIQDELGLDLKNRGRFKDDEATIVDGQDLDIPSFVRRGIKLSFQ